MTRGADQPAIERRSIGRPGLPVPQVADQIERLDDRVQAEKSDHADAGTEVAVKAPGHDAGGQCRGPGQLRPAAHAELVIAADGTGETGRHSPITRRLTPGSQRPNILVSHL